MIKSRVVVVDRFRGRFGSSFCVGRLSSARNTRTLRRRACRRRVRAALGTRREGGKRQYAGRDDRNLVGSHQWFHLPRRADWRSSRLCIFPDRVPEISADRSIRHLSFPFAQQQISWSCHLVTCLKRQSWWLVATAILPNRCSPCAVYRRGSNLWVHRVFAGQRDAPQDASCLHYLIEAASTGSGAGRAPQPRQSAINETSGNPKIPIVAAAGVFLSGG